MTMEQALSTLASHKGRVDANELGARMAAIIVEFAVREGASDVHFDPVGEGVVVRFRIDGQLYDRFSYLNADFPLISRLRVMANFPPRAASFFTPEDGRFEIQVDGRSVQFRVSSFPMVYGEKLVLRVLNISSGVTALDGLGLPKETLACLQALIHSPSGMFVVAGLTGSGKTTTLCSVLRAVSGEHVNVMTLEDPVEYILPRVIHSQINPKAGFTFADGLRSILRQDPNVIMVGEVRDQETAEVAMRAAMTGHMIFCTVHATTAVGVIHRFISMGIESYLISGSINGTMAQRLVRTVCPQCVRAVQEPKPEAFDALLRRLEHSQAEWVRAQLAGPGGKYVEAAGCPACKGTGYRGRVGIFELLAINDEIRALIGRKADLLDLRRVVQAGGMRTLLHDAVEKTRAGMTTIEEVARVVSE